MIRLSYSAIKDYFAPYDGEGSHPPCPAAWKYHRELEPVGAAPRTFADTGSLVHSMLDGETDPATVTNDTALMFYSKLDALRQSIGLQVIKGLKHDGAEFFQKIKILPGVEIVRKIDLIGRVSFYKELILGDWKTSGAIFKSLESDPKIVPQALSMQGITYLIPPEQKHLDRLGIKKWPRRLLYFVAGFRGSPTWFEYEYSKIDHENLLDAAATVATAIREDRFPKIRDKHCLKCPFVGPCFDQKGWRKKFKKKGTHKK